jgi:hypothetical protein
VVAVVDVAPGNDLQPAEDDHDVGVFARAVGCRPAICEEQRVRAASRNPEGGPEGGPEAEPWMRRPFLALAQPPPRSQTSRTGACDGLSGWRSTTWPANRHPLLPPVLSEPLRSVYSITSAL